MPIYCPKCGDDIEPWLADFEDKAAYIARAHAQYGACKHVVCDSLECRALKDPQTLDEWRDAAEHWRSHSCLGGCSHSR